MLGDEFSLSQPTLVRWLLTRKDEPSTPSSNAIFGSIDYFNYQMQSLSIGGFIIIFNF